MVIPSNEVITVIGIWQLIRAAASKQQGCHHCCSLIQRRQMLTIRPLLQMLLLLLRLKEQVLKHVALVIEPVYHPAQLVAREVIEQIGHHLPIAVVVFVLGNADHASNASAAAAPAVAGVMLLVKDAAIVVEIQVGIVVPGVISKVEFIGEDASLSLLLLLLESLVPLLLPMMPYPHKMVLIEGQSPPTPAAGVAMASCGMGKTPPPRWMLLLP